MRQTLLIYIAIIAGGSLAGLAAAIKLRGKRVLLIKPHSVGPVRTSARGTLLAALMVTGTTNSLLHVHESMSGLETVIPVEKQRLHLDYDKWQLGADDVGWWLPIGPVSRADIRSNRGATRLNAALNGLVRNYLGCSSNDIHGGYRPFHHLLGPLPGRYWKAMDPAALALLWSTGPAGSGSPPPAHVQGNLGDPTGRMSWLTLWSF